MRIDSLFDLKCLASQKMSVCRLHGKIFGKEFIPAVVLLNMSGVIILREINKQLIIYKPRGK